MSFTLLRTLARKGIFLVSTLLRTLTRERSFLFLLSYALWARMGFFSISSTLLRTIYWYGKFSISTLLRPEPVQQMHMLFTLLRTLMLTKKKLDLLPSLPPSLPPFLSLSCADKDFIPVAVLSRSLSYALNELF